MRVFSVGNVFPPHSLGGYEVVWRGLVRNLREHGHHALVLTTDYRSPSAPPDAEEDPEVHRELRWYWRDHDWPQIGKLERFAIERHNASVFDRHLNAFQPDVLTWWPMGGMSLSLIERGRRAGLPSVLFVHDYWPTYGPRHDVWSRTWEERAAFGRIAEAVTGVPTRYDLAAAGRWLFNSSCVRERTLASGIALRDADILAPGISSWYSAQEPEAARRDWSWRLLYLGRVVGQKGVHTAVEALASLPKEATLRIVGDGDEPYRRRLEELASQLGVTHRITFEPSRYGDDLLETYRQVDALLFPVTWAEPFGLVPLEAMALGIPVVATGEGGSGDYLLDGFNTILFKSGDADSLSAALHRLAGSPELRAELHAGGLQTVSSHSEAAFNERALAEIARAAAQRTLPSKRK